MPYGMVSDNYLLAVHLPSLLRFIASLRLDASAVFSAASLSAKGTQGQQVPNVK
jgi:hypothetical protein